MEALGMIRKMQVSDERPVQYHLVLGDRRIDMNALIGREVEMEYRQQIHCIRCGRQTRSSFAQGYCYPCFTTAPETEECVLKPELCRAHEGVARDMDHAREHCLSTQIVYLSLTSGLKVGVTRLGQRPTRWMDQGAVAALELARTPTRFLAGQIEVDLKRLVADKTNWRRMLSEVDPGSLDLLEAKERLGGELPDELKQYLVPDREAQVFQYPVERYPQKIKSLNFDKDPLVRGKLAGIKGQYLIFEDDHVINLRKFGGYEIRLSYQD